MTTTYIGIGSNIDPENNLKAAADLLRKEFPGIRFSSVYRSTPVGLKEQEDFLNAAAVLETDETPENVAKTLRSIEKKLKKKITKRFGPRTIDLDLLLYGQEINLDDKLTIPHLAMHQRRFVLEPLIELGAGDVLHPGFDRKLRHYLEDAKHQECEKTKLKL